jgi:hypothetical protein
LNMIGLEAYRPDLTDYRQCIDTIESHVKQFTVDELEKMNARERQAGVEALKWEDFKKTSHVSTMRRNSLRGLVSDKIRVKRFFLSPHGSSIKSRTHRLPPHSQHRQHRQQQAPNLKCSPASAFLSYAESSPVQPWGAH